MHLIPRQCSKPNCPSGGLVCTPVCSADQICFPILGDNCTCDTASCVARPPSGKPSNNPGAIAGGVLGALFAVALVAAFFWYRKRQQHFAALAKKRATVVEKPDIVARPDAVLSRPDPVKDRPISHQQKRQEPEIRVYYSDGDIDLDPNTAKDENPFSDEASIATASDRATNVIPIAYVPPSSASALTAVTDISDFTSKTPASVDASTMAPPARPISSQTGSSIGPIRPARGPEIEDMRLNISRPDSQLTEASTLAPPRAPYAPSAISGVSGMSGVSGVSSRASFISTTSSFLNEAPQIITPMQAGFKQVVGLQKAAVVQLKSTPPTPGLTVNTARAGQGGSMRSPLAQSAYTASDTEDPFSDIASVNPPLSAGSTSTFGSPRIGGPNGPGWDESRPASMMSHAGTIIADIGSAQRVQLAHNSARGSQISTATSDATFLSAPSTPRQGDFRTAGQLSPPAQGVPKSFDDDLNHRMSQASMATSRRTSTADSILESFPFVPPSPISMHHNASQPPSPLSPRGFQQQQQQQTDFGRLQPPSRQALGMSVMSSTSAASSSGLGSFPFEFGADDTNSALPSPSPNARESRASRASLDTLALSRDLEAFPLPSYDTPDTPRDPNGPARK